MDSIFSSIVVTASGVGKAAYGVLGNLGLSSGGQSAVLLVIFAAFVLAVIGFWLGRTRIIISIISVFAGYFIENNFAFISTSGSSDYLIRLGVFVVAFAISFFVMSRSVLKNRISSKDSSIISIIILSLINTGLLTSVVISYLPADTGMVPSQLSGFIATKTARFAWAVIALIVLFFLKGKREVSPISKR